MNKTVIFTSNNSRVVTGYVKVDKMPHVVNPDLSGVAGVPPHYWKLTRDGKIVPMNKVEMAERDQLLSKGVDNDIRVENYSPLSNRIKKVLYTKYKYLIGIGIGILIGMVSRL